MLHQHGLYIKKGSAYQIAINALRPSLYYRLNETSGNTALDSSPTGNHATIGGTTTLGSTGLAPNTGTGYTLDGLTSRLALSSPTAIGSNDWTWCFLVSPTNAGEGNTGTFTSRRDSVGGQQSNVIFFTALTAFQVGLHNSANTFYRTRTTTGITALTPTWLFIRYNITAEGLVRLYKATTSVPTVTEYAYSLQEVFAGSAKAYNEAWLFNNTSSSATFAGVADEVIAFNYVLTVPQLQSIVTAGGWT